MYYTLWSSTGIPYTAPYGVKGISICIAIVLTCPYMFHLDIIYMNVLLIQLYVHH